MRLNLFLAPFSLLCLLPCCNLVPHIQTQVRAHTHTDTQNSLPHSSESTCCFGLTSIKHRYEICVLIKLINTKPGDRVENLSFSLASFVSLAFFCFPCFFSLLVSTRVKEAEVEKAYRTRWKIWRGIPNVHKVVMSQLYSRHAPEWTWLQKTSRVDSETWWAMPAQACES